MTLEEWHAYLKEIQGTAAVDPETLSSYRQLVERLNAAVRAASREVLEFEDEPAHFLRALRELRR